ncbi:hypothetical protein BaRGS_00005558 [Batillaria attramentaria]|uniref:Major facilitator superfamily (MFS) profile domain-containing protein n=1 Tax=Batillaria attramentaria TaxID=370345 RepID=A0ABD0LVS2_9CAEN
MTYEDVITLLGEFGFYQKRVYFLLCLPAISGCMQALMSVFTLAVPDHRCAIPGLDNDTWDLQDSKHTAMFNASIPTSDTLSSMCRLYADVTPRLRTSNWSYPMVRNGNFSYADNEGQGLRETTSCSRYVYDTSSYTSTIVTQMDLVCENQLLRSHAQMVFMSGALFGSVACGLPSDIFGRKKMLMISLVLHSVASLVITWSSYFPFLCVLLFLNGAAVTGIFTNAFVIGMELVGPSKRVWTGYVMEIFWSLGMMLLAPIAFFVRDWQRLQLTTSLLTLPFLSYWWLVPESPRWLMSRGRRQEAEAILQTVAKTNKVCLPEKLLDGAECLREEERQVEEESVLAALQHPAILTRCFVIFYAWMVSSLTFYGLNLNVGSLSGNVYVNFLLSGIMELVSYILCLCLLDRVGRRALNCGLMILAGVTCTATIFPVLYAPPCKNEDNQ